MYAFGRPLYEVVSRNTGRQLTDSGDEETKPRPLAQSFINRVLHQLPYLHNIKRCDNIDQIQNQDPRKLTIMSSSDKAVTLYDILLDPKAFPGAPNPWKTR
jgi:hypothetical protein